MSDDLPIEKELPERPEPAPRAPVDRSAWARPWAQLKYFTFAPAIFPRLLGQTSPDARPGDFVNVYDKHGELCGDGLSGLTIDRYGETLLCEIYSLGIAQRLPRWLPLLHELAGTKFARVHVDHDLGSLECIKPSTFKETNAVAPDHVKIREHGVRYEVDFAEGHKTGFFCDQRENRKAITRFTKGARVLDLCCYTGGFSLNAKVPGGAAEVTSVDLDEVALEQAK